MSNLHRCPTCHAKHHAPKPHHAVLAIIYAVIFTIVEVFAALALDGWISWALWVIAARNVLVAVLWLHGLAQLAADGLTAGNDV